MTEPIRILYRALFLTSLTVTLFTSCSPTDGEDVGAQQDPEKTVDEIIDDPGNPYAGSGQAAPVELFPFFHAAVGLKYAGQEILIDPYNGAERYADDFNEPDLILITHTHPDHMDMATLKGLTLSSATVVGPKAVTDQLGAMGFADVVTMDNGDTTDHQGIKVRAVPAYNYPQGDKAFHKKGDFNGYVVTMGNESYYFSGDTGPAPELEDIGVIDYAFVSMNQPYTMTVEQAANMVTKLGAGTVYPYHYRNKDGTFSDVEEFKRLVEEAKVGVKVILQDWYPEAK